MGAHKPASFKGGKVVTDIAIVGGGLAGSLTAALRAVAKPVHARHGDSSAAARDDSSSSTCGRRHPASAGSFVTVVVAFQVSCGEDSRTTLPVSGRSGMSAASVTSLRIGLSE